MLVYDVWHVRKSWTWTYTGADAWRLTFGFSAWVWAWAWALSWQSQVRFERLCGCETMAMLCDTQVSFDHYITGLIWSSLKMQNEQIGSKTDQTIAKKKNTNHQKSNRQSHPERYAQPDPREPRFRCFVRHVSSFNRRIPSFSLCCISSRYRASSSRRVRLIDFRQA